MKKNIVRIVIAVVLLALIAFALALKQSAETYNSNREDEAENGKIQQQQ